MSKHRNKKRRKLNELRERLNKLHSLNYYHKQEDGKDLEKEIKYLKNGLK